MQLFRLLFLNILFHIIYCCRFFFPLFIVSFPGSKTHCCNAETNQKRRDHFTWGMFWLCWWTSWWALALPAWGKLEAQTHAQQESMALAPCTVPWLAHHQLLRQGKGHLYFLDKICRWAHVDWLANKRHTGVLGAVVLTPRACILILACAQTGFCPKCRLSTCTIQGKVVPGHKLGSMNG